LTGRLTATRHRRARVISVACAVLTLTAGCGLLDETAGEEPVTSAASEPAPPMGGRLVMAVPAESNGWNPLVNQWTDSGSLVGASVIEPLAIQDNDGRPLPWLAEKWEPNADYTSWTITVRDGVYFHDGTLMDANAVKVSLDASFNRGLHMVAETPYKGIEVVGPRSIRVDIKSRWAHFPVSLANTWVMAPSMLDREDDGTVHPIGTGPFVFSSWEQGKSFKASRFDRYWRKDDKGRQLPYLDAIEFRPITEEAERERALESGLIDAVMSDGGRIATSVDPAKYTAIKDYDGQRTYLVLNTSEGPNNRGNPFVNLHARRALAYATNREKIAALVGEGVRSTTYGFRSDSIWAPTGDDGYFPYDPIRARAEVEAYKRETRRRDFTFTVLGLSSPDVQRVLVQLQQDLREVGIEMRIEGIEAAKVMVLAALGNYQALWFRFHDFPDPDQGNFYMDKENVKPAGSLGVNFTRYSSDLIDQNVDVIRESTDQAERKAASDLIVREANEQVVNLWLFNTPAAIVHSNDVGGLDGFRRHAFANPLPKPWLGEAWIKR
jgi:peptide/nickel transport system substrate-binding protein